MKKSLIVLLFGCLFFVKATAQQKTLISGPWAGNVELRTAMIWAEVSPTVKPLCTKEYWAINSIQ